MFWIIVLVSLMAATAVVGIMALKKRLSSLWAFVPGALFALMLFYSTWVYVPQGSVGVIDEFGVIQTDRVIPEGTVKPFGVWPWQGVHREDIKADNLDFRGAHHFSGRTSDKVIVTIDFVQTIRVNQEAMPWLKVRLKADWRQFIEPYVIACLADTVAKKPWMDVYQSDRAGVEALFMDNLKKTLPRILEENGVPAHVALTAFVFSDPQFGGRVGLPKEIEDSLHKQTAVKIDQETSVLRAQVAANDVKTRMEEGKGYGSLLENLPPNVTPEKAAAMMLAQAELKKVHLLEDLAKNGKLNNVTIIIGGGAPPSVPTK